MSNIQYSIEEKLDIIVGIKSNIRDAVNNIAEEEIIGATTPFTQYAQLILDNLCKCQKTSYTVTFNKNGGSGTAPSSVTVNVGQSITLPEYSGTREGYTLKKTNDHMLWCENSNGTGTQYQAGSSYTPIANKTLYVVWQVNQYPVTLNYGWDGERNTTSKTVSLDYGTTPTLNSFGLTATDLNVTGYKYTLPTFTTVKSNPQQNIYNVTYTPLETYYYMSVANDDGQTIDFEDGGFSDFDTSSVNLSDGVIKKCTFILIPNAKKARLEFTSDGITSVVEECLDSSCSQDQTKLLRCEGCVINLPGDNYKVLVYEFPQELHTSSATITIMDIINE